MIVNLSLESILQFQSAVGPVLWDVFYFVHFCLIEGCAATDSKMFFLEINNTSSNIGLHFPALGFVPLRFFDYTCFVVCVPDVFRSHRRIFQGKKATTNELQG